MFLPFPWLVPVVQMTSNMTQRIVRQRGINNNLQIENHFMKFRVDFWFIVKEISYYFSGMIMGNAVP